MSTMDRILEKLGLRSLQEEGFEEDELQEFKEAIGISSALDKELEERNLEDVIDDVVVEINEVNDKLSNIIESLNTLRTGLMEIKAGDSAEEAPTEEAQPEVQPASKSEEPVVEQRSLETTEPPSVPPEGEAVEKADEGEAKVGVSEIAELKELLAKALELLEENKAKQAELEAKTEELKAANEELKASSEAKVKELEEKLVSTEKTLESTTRPIAEPEEAQAVKSGLTRLIETRILPNLKGGD